MQVTFGRFACAVACAVAGLIACERADTRLDNLTAGITKDSVTAVMGGPPKRLDPYLIAGQYIETMYYSRLGKTDSASLTDRRMAPVVVINGKLAGWGWDFWDSTAEAHRIRVATKK